MHENLNISSQETIFLHSNQINISLLNKNILKFNFIFFSLNKTIIQSINIDINLIELIKNILLKNRNINSYIELFKNSIISYNDDIKAYLKSFFLHKQ